ncbi:septum formation initiator family protein [Stenoxybacter acetivorans]|uniref:septum formation initiator family protein n=1 Tax=Stenoxybacter acetivorans TaxID=422441 RepID=UPI00056CBF87|nr:septum formation initiator family protein [Stenoxybacter acetivorans]
MKWVTWVLSILLLSLQYNLWFSENGYNLLEMRKKEIAKQEAVNLKLEARNQALAANIADLKDGNDALSEMARMDFGYIQEGEVFYRLVELK